MDTPPIVLVFFYGQLWWNYVSANPTPPNPRPAVIGPPARLQQTSTSGDPVKDGRQTPTTKPGLPPGEEPKPYDGHTIAAVLIGVILTVMIIVIVGIFLWRRWRKASSSPLPHWAGRSPFADGDIPDVGAEKEPAPGVKRTSVLSLLPWKFNKDTQLLESVGGEASEPEQNLEASSKCGAEETGKRSSLATTGNSVSSTSLETGVSEGSSILTHVPLQADDPDPLELPPPPNWLGEVNGDLSPNHPETLSVQASTENQCAVPVDQLSSQNPGEAMLLPPPPEDFCVTELNG
ncbi:protein EVI2B [Elgaria multicarinata webbii]|uniref:protein EVI2B n=1 Tax=Elgaria multicarinata webbii TaxID=159646 RepID=UPI002FCCF200